MLPLYRSRDLRKWEYLGLFAAAKNTPSAGGGAVGGRMWECPEFFVLGKKPLLIVNIRNTYFTGVYEDRKFEQQGEGQIDYGLVSAAKTMAVELGPQGIRVVAVAPGTTLTEQVAATFDEAHVAAIVESTPLRRMTEPDELARLVVFLASDLARCITGQLILADAGAHLSRTRPPNTEPAGKARR